MTDDREGPRFPPPTKEPVAITDVTVVPMDSNRELSDRTVVIAAGRITALGRASEVPIEGARVIDGRGKFLMPGLADMHVHYWDVGEFGMFLANGVTTVRNMWGSPFHLALRRKVEEGRFPGPRIVTTTPIIDGPGPNGTTIWPGSSLAADPSQARPMVRDFIARGYEQTKVYSWLKLDVLRALGQASREAGVRAVGHCPDGITYEEAIEAGMTCFEHLTGIAAGRLRGRTLLGMRPGSIEAIRTVLEHFELDAVRPLAQFLAERDIWNCPTLVVWQGMSQKEEVAMANPLLVYERPATVAGWNPANDFRFRSTMGSREEWLALAGRRNELYLQVISILHEEGAPLLLGTDTPNPFVFQGFAVQDELTNLVEAGLSRYEALRSGTADAARFLGQEKEWGTVEVGKRADLLLLDGNPLDDLGTIWRPRSVFVNGYVFTRDDLDALLEQRAEAVRSGQLAAAPPLPAGEEGNAVVQGALVERVAGVPVGALAYRHARTRGGGWRIDEVRESSADSLHSWGGRSTAHLELSPSLELLQAELRGESFLGTELCQIYLDAGTYTARHVAIDGWRTTSQLGGPLPPGEDLAFTAIPLRLAQGSLQEESLATLGIQEERATPLPLAISHPSPGVWQVRVDRAGTSVEQAYRLDRRGRLERIEEQTWRGLREVLPADQSSLDAPPG